MSGIHKSREVYKFTTTERDGRVIIPVRGLYVSGLHTEPWYIDSYIDIVGYTSRPATIRDYYESDISVNLDALSMSGFESTQIEVVGYSSTSVSYSLDALSLTGFISTPLNIIPYTSSAVTSNLNSLSLSGFESTAINIEEYYTVYVDSSLESILSIDTYTSSTCTITDVTS